MPEYPSPPAWVAKALREGVVIPAHPLALTRQGRFDERRQRALSRYYHAAGAGGVALGVHTTQFEIRDKKIGLFKPVLRLGVETLRAADEAARRETVLVAGICGRTAQAAREAEWAARTGYHAGLLSLAALRGVSDARLLSHCKAVAERIPLFGFYLQPAAGGRPLSFRFWRQFAEIPNVVAIKVAPFNRYQTLDVVRAVAEAGRAKEISLYTGNDDSIVGDLLTEFRVPTRPKMTRLHFAGGLLGHWACWTRSAVELLQACKAARRNQNALPDLLARGVEVTDCNGAFFDAANGFAGCIAGINEVLRRQGLLGSARCLDPEARLSPGQKAEINRVCRSYPHLRDDRFVAEHLDEWMR